MRVSSLTQNEPVWLAWKSDHRHGSHVHLVRSQLPRSGLSHLSALPSRCHTLAPAVALRFSWSRFLSQLQHIFGLWRHVERRGRSMTSRPWKSIVPLDQIRKNPGAMVADCGIELRKSPLCSTGEQRVDVVEEYPSRSMVLPVHTRDIAQEHASRRRRSIGFPDHQMVPRPCHRHLLKYLGRRRRRSVRGKARIRSESHILTAESRRQSVAIQDKTPLEKVL